MNNSPRHLDVLHKTPGGAELLFAHGACQHHGFTVRSVGLCIIGIKFIIIGFPCFIIIIMLARPCYTRGPNTFLIQ